MENNTPVMTAKGINGILELYENKIRISRTGFNALILQGLKGDKYIALSQISSVHMEKASLLSNSGYIQFTLVGGHEAKGGIFQAAQDENTIMFRKEQERDFEIIKEAIEKKVYEGPRSSSGIDDLEKLVDLKAQGIITEEEFNAKKKQILGQ